MATVIMAIVLPAAVRADGPPSEAATLAEQAADRVERGDLDAAIADCDRVIRLDPGIVDAYLNRARALDRKGDFGRAIADLDRAVQISPNRSDLHLCRSLVRGRLGQIESALADVARAIELDPETQDARIFLARASLRDKKGDIDGAIADYSEALRLDPKSVAGWNNRGMIWMGKTEYDRAIADFDRVIELAPQNAIGFVNRGNCRVEKRDYDPAISDLTKALELDPKNGVAYLHRAKSLRGKREFDRAIGDFSEALRLLPQRSQEMVKPAVKYVMTSTAKSPRPELYGKSGPEQFVAIAHMDRALCRTSPGRYEEALADFDEAIRRAPELHWPYQEQAWLLAGCPDPKYRDGKRALESARRACELTGWNHSYSVPALAAAYAETGDFDSAVAYEEKALVLWEKDGHGAGDQERLNLYKQHRPFRLTREAGSPSLAGATEAAPR